MIPSHPIRPTRPGVALAIFVMVLLAYLWHWIKMLLAQ